MRRIKHSHTLNGAKTSAVIYSIAETAKANNLKPYDYFEYLLTEIPKQTDEMDEYQVYPEIIKENIDVESLVQRFPYEQKDGQEIYDLIVETVVGKGGKYDYFRTAVSKRTGEDEVPEAEHVTCGVCDGVHEAEYHQDL